MNAGEKLQAAIEKLEALRIERGYIEHAGWLVEENLADSGGFLQPPEPLIPITNDELMVVLHRTIDAQLAILRTALHYVSSGLRYGFVEEQGVALADAILGES
jgi:hypothetical protein